MSNGFVTYRQLGRYGRFANGVFQVMSTIGIARKNGMDFKFPQWINHDHKERFGSTEDVDIYKHLVNDLPLWTGEMYPERFVNWGYEEVFLTGNTDIFGHLQSERFFKNGIAEVRHYLTFKDEPGDLDAVAVHWRAGDYQEGGADVYHPRCSREYYVQAMQQFPREAPFLVFSDDWALAALMFDSIGDDLGVRIQIIRPEINYIESFKIMKNCHSFICANSSYSLAAAILADQPGKKIVAPALWFGKPAGGLRMDYPQNCIVI